MPILQGFQVAQQALPNSCWAAVSRSILNYFDGADVYPSDQALGDAWSDADPGADPPHSDISVQQSAAAALEDLHVANGTDGHTLPTFDEICGQIDAGIPLLTFISGDQIDPNHPNVDAQDGHWMAIVGYAAIEGQDVIWLMDPEGGSDFVYVPYDPSICAGYEPTQYWQHTSWLTRPPAVRGN